MHSQPGAVQQHGEPVTQHGPGLFRPSITTGGRPPVAVPHMVAIRARHLAPLAPQQASHKSAKRQRQRVTEGTYTDPLCKRCGRRKNSDRIAAGKHGHRVKKNSARYCRVSPEDYETGFPLDGYQIDEPQAEPQEKHREASAALWPSALGSGLLPPRLPMEPGSNLLPPGSGLLPPGPHDLSLPHAHIAQPDPVLPPQIPHRALAPGLLSPVTSQRTNQREKSRRRKR